MELANIFLFLKKFKLKLLLFSLIGMGVGVILFYFLPLKYYAIGSIFIKREIYPYNIDHFTYEGYYSQQAAASYTNSVIGLVESDDLTAKSLSELGIEINEKNLRQYSQKIKATKTGPQIITITTKGKTKDDANFLWNAVTSTTISTMQKINNQNDPYVGLIKISDEPIIKESYKNVYAFAIAGLTLGKLVGIFILSLKSYLSPSKRK